MAIEDAVIRLAGAIDRQESCLAVKEIIRQRDIAYEQRDRWKADSDYYEQNRNRLSRELDTEKRRTRSLRVVIRNLKASK